jgi:MSHA biogenesis protein MshN
MSVINRMLRDLDARATSASLAPPPPEAFGAQAALPPLPTRRGAARWRLPALVLLGGGAIALAALADLSPLLARKAPPLGPLEAAAPLAAPASAPPAEVPSTPSHAPAPPLSPSLSPSPEAAAPGAPSPAAPPARTRASASPAPAPLEALLARAAPPPLATPARIDKRIVPPSPAQRAAAALREAVDLARAGQRQAALARALQALALEPTHAGARQLAAVLQHESGAHEQALALLREGAALDAAPPALTLLLARLLADQGQADEALAVLERHALHSPEAEGLRAGLLAQRGDYTRALPAYESATRQQPGNPLWWFGLAVALDAQGQGERAHQAYTLAQRLGLPREDLVTYAEQRLRALD